MTDKNADVGSPVRNPVPEHRAKSYRREHEEKRNRRLQRLHQKCSEGHCVTGAENCALYSANKHESAESSPDPSSGIRDISVSPTELSLGEGVAGTKDDAVPEGPICSCPDIGYNGIPCSECVSSHEKKVSKFTSATLLPSQENDNSTSDKNSSDIQHYDDDTSRIEELNNEQPEYPETEKDINDPSPSDSSVAVLDENVKNVTVENCGNVNENAPLPSNNDSVEVLPMENDSPCVTQSDVVPLSRNNSTEKDSSLIIEQGGPEIPSKIQEPATELKNQKTANKRSVHFPENVETMVVPDSPMKSAPCDGVNMEGLKSSYPVEDFPIPDYKIIYDIQDLHDAQERVLESIGNNADNEETLMLCHITVLQEQLDKIAKLRHFNQQVASIRPDESYYSRFDSSLKKNRAFVRKLKTFLASQLEPLLADLSTLNLTKYVSEAASALVEAKLKMSDVPYAVKLCSAIHQRYSDFSSHFLECWQRALVIKREDKTFNQTKVRVDLRFYADLINIGIFTQKEGLPLLGNILTVLTSMDKEEHNNINVILTFCRYCGEVYAGLIPRRIRCLAEKYHFEIPRSTLLTKEKQRNVRSLLKEYYSSLCKHILKEHCELQAFEKQNRKILQTKGELSAERKERKANLEVSLQRLLAGVVGFSEILDEDMPHLPEDDSARSEGMNFKVGNSESEDGSTVSPVWEDEETQMFYENLPNMKEFLPNISVKPIEVEAKVSEEALKADLEDIDDVPKEENLEEPVVPPEPDEAEEQESQTNVSNKAMLEAFLSQLPHCVNREMIDTFAVDFVMNLNTKFNRRKLVKALFTVPRTRLDLLPFYARFVAILYPVMPDVATELGQFLKQDFKYHLHKKDQINIESKVKVVRFIGELTKFRMYSKIEALYCFKLLLHDFTYHHIEMCCNFLESCGRFLLRNPDSHQRTKVYLEQMMRKKSVTALDSRYVTMIENAYYHVNPPETSTYVKKERPPAHEFLRKILYQDLAKANTDKILKLMRKIDWKNEELAAYAVKCLTYAFNVKYYNIRCLANLVAGLVAFQEFVGHQVVDGVMEDIRIGMEINQPKYNQRRVAMIKYLGELYNYRVVESGDIFKVLYSLITFGVNMSHTEIAPLDPPEHLFRIRLVCLLLETCGLYFNAGASKKKLDCFIVYFQNYVQYKMSHPFWTNDNPFPVGIKYMYKDTLLTLRPKLRLYESYEASQKGVKEMNDEFLELLKQQQRASRKSNVIEEESLSDIIDEGDEDSVVDDQFDEVSDDIEADKYDHGDGNVEEGNGQEDDYDSHHEAIDSEVGAGDATTQGYQSRFHDMDTPPPADYENESDANSPTDEKELRNINGVSIRPKHVDCAEDDEFLNAFEKMVSGNMQERMQTPVKPQHLDISVPLHIKNNTKKTYEQLQQAKKEVESATMNFVLLVRKGLKKQYKSLSVPLTSELAVNLKDREEAERAEKQHVKRLTLDINERLEEEDYQEMLSQNQKPFVISTNREKKQKYQHPKGAPDVDVIFGGRKGS